jgi:RNA ligase
MDIAGMFTYDELVEQLDAGNVRVQSNEDKTLFIYNYTESAQYNRVWNNVTLNCRGLILDEYGTIVARPWKKFFNYGEGRLMINDDQPVEVTDKMDGSLGILYPVRDTVRKFNGGNPIDVEYVDWKIATRGSFNSDQAVHATRVWEDRYADFVEPDDAYTFLFEIIYPKNRIVLNYGELDDLILLGAVHKERGYYLGPREAAGILGWPGPVTQTFEYKNLAEAFAAPMRENAEGFVCRSGTEMVKIKQVDYVELHKIVTNLNERTVWGALAGGQTVEDLCAIVPDEWHDWLRETADELEGKFDQIQAAVLDEFLDIQARVGRKCEWRFDSISRKDWAQEIVKSPNKAYLFLLLDKKPIDGPIWYSLKPKVDKE